MLEIILVVVTAISLILHLPPVRAYILKTKTQWDDRAVAAVDKVKAVLEK